MTEHNIKYEIIGKACVEQGGDKKLYALKLLYRGDRTPWWVCSAGLELPVPLEMFEAVSVGSSITLNLQFDSAVA